MKQEFPFEIPPRQSVEILCELEVLEPGRFGNDLQLFVDDQGLREITLKVHGEAKARTAAKP